MAKGNPYGANQVVIDPRQALFIQYYLDTKSETFSNGLQSAIRAGYEETYAAQLVARMPPWLLEEVSSRGMLDLAERNLLKFLQEQDKDISKFVAERLGKKRWSSRTELSGPDGESLIQTPNEELERRIENLEARASKENDSPQGSDRLNLLNAGDSVPVE